MPSYIDPEFGEIIIHKRRGARSVRIRIGTDGRYTATVPSFTPIVYIKQVINHSRGELRELAKNTSIAQPYRDGQQVSRAHALAVVPTSMVTQPRVKAERQRLLVYLPPGYLLEQTEVQQLIRDEVARILRREAKAYLPGRLEQLARQHGFHYERVRFSHAGSRWGSCSTNGTISLNIALMKLPDVIIDYVLVHELAHTRQMNHSTMFWQEVAALDPLYKLHRQQLKRETPTV